MQKKIRHTFSSDERLLLLSYLFFFLAWPVFGTFTNTFLWRHSHDIVTVALFTMGLYTGMPLGFVLNAGLLRKFSHKTLFFAGCLLQGVSPLVLTLLVPPSLTVIAILGGCMGLPMGLYWGNRNYLTLRATEGGNRMPFISRESVQSTIASILVPAVVGAYLVSMQTRIGLGYVIVTSIAFALLFLAGLLVRSTAITTTRGSATPLFVRRVSHTWNAMRAFDAIGGAITANESLLSLLMILTFLGVEDAVGGVKSGVAIISALMMFFVGKHVRTKDYRLVLALSLVIIGGASIFFAFDFSPVSVITAFVATGFIAGFRGTTFSAVMYRAVDGEAARTKNDKFSLLLDREIFLNLGRVTALVTLVVLVTFFPTATLRYGLLVSSAFHIVLMLLLPRLERNS